MAATLLLVGGAQAQDCEALMLPFFGGNADRMAEYPAEKLEWRCKYAQNAFYVSDTVPAGVEVIPITEVKNKLTGEPISADIKIDLNTFSYYAYTFIDFQVRHKRGNVTYCFSTPASDHPYLVLRSLDEAYFRTEFPEQYITK